MIDKSDGLVHLVGKVGRAPAFQALASGGDVMTLDLNTRTSAAAGTRHGIKLRTQRLAWHRIIAFAPAVHRAARDLALDDVVSVHGFVERHHYERDGKRHELWEIVAERIERLSRARPSRDKPAAWVAQVSLSGSASNVISCGCVRATLAIAASVVADQGPPGR